MEGFRIGRYQLESKLAVGGMAEIWLARQQGPAGFTKRLVIKKILPHLAADPSFVEMFLHEGRIAAMINNPHVVQVFELGADSGNYYLVMEHVPGWSLRNIINRSVELKKPMPDACIAHVTIGMCLGLHAAHELVDATGKPLGLVHRDVSPENVLVTRTGQAKVTDFGIAKATANVSSTQPGMAKGKMGYMPPEQLLGQTLDRRADLYAVGVTLYELLCGERPLKVPGDAALSLAILKEKPVPLRVRRPDVPGPLEALCARALEKDRTLRPQDAMAMVRELEAYVSSTGVSATAVGEYLGALFPPELYTPVATPMPGTAQLQQTGSGAPTRAGAPTVQSSVEPAPRRGRSALVVLLLMLVAVGGGGGAWWSSQHQEPTQEPVEPRPAGVVEPQPPPPQKDPAPPPVADPAPPVETPLPPPPPKKQPKGGKGKILVRVNPWGDVVLDGRVIGQTPLPAMEVSSGKHTVTVSNGELNKTRTVTVEVRPGRQELVEINLGK